MYWPLAREVEVSRVPVGSWMMVMEAPATGLPSLSATMPLMAEVVMPWANADVADARSAATAIAFRTSDFRDDLCMVQMQLVF